MAGSDCGQTELVRLRKEVGQLRMEREILKKAAVFFAKEVEYEASTEFTMVVAKWHVRRTSGAPKALAVALSFCRLLGLGCPKQAFAKIQPSRSLSMAGSERADTNPVFSFSFNISR
jgi:hypothetical protein